MSTKKMGRPTQNPKTEQIKIRATKEDKAILEECCETLGLTQYEVIMMGVRCTYLEFKNKNSDKDG